jgi:hypothetical protein
MARQPASALSLLKTKTMGYPPGLVMFKAHGEG